MTSNDTTKILEPNSFAVYIAILILSLIIFLASCSGIMFCLYYSYKEWSELIHQYCSNIVNFKIAEFDCESHRDGVIDVVATFEMPKCDSSCEEEEEPKEAVELPRFNPDNLSARFTKIRVVVGETSEDIQVVEIEPTGFVDNEKRIERQIQSRGPNRDLGLISFTLHYFPEKEELHIKELGGAGLRKKHSQELPNPYIIVNIWPDHIWPIKTKALKRKNNPTWNETIIIEQFEHEKLANKALHLKIQSKKPIVSDDLIGHVILPLQIIKTVGNNSYKESFVKHIQPDLQINRGFLRLLLLYSDNIAELKVSILNAELKYPFGTSSDQCQVFVRVSVNLPNVSPDNKSTAISRGTFKPVWNEHFTFKVSKEELYKHAVVISVREESFSKDGKLFAYTQLGHEHTESNNLHLYTSLKHPGKTFAQWHQLISNIL